MGNPPKKNEPKLALIFSRGGDGRGERDEKVIFIVPVQSDREPAGTPIESYG